MVKKYIIPALLLLLLSSCFYSVYSNAQPHLKKIRVQAFDNRSTEFALGETLLSGLNKKFRDDGRLKLVTIDPDCTLEGTISSFSEKVYSYDAANQVQDYQVQMTVAVTFTDLVKNQVLYENKNLTISELYAVSTGGTARFKSKEEAIDELINKLFQTIMQNSLESW